MKGLYEITCRLASFLRVLLLVLCPEGPRGLREGRLHVSWDLQNCLSGPHVVEETGIALIIQDNPLVLRKGSLEPGEPQLAVIGVISTKPVPEAGLEASTSILPDATSPPLFCRGNGIQSLKI